MGGGGHFPEVKQPESKADHSPPTSDNVMNEWSFAYTDPYVFMV
jgi:hypothetical protein